MSVGAIFIGLALLITSVFVVAGPVVNKRRERFSLADEPEGTGGQANYRSTLLALRDLDFDHQLGVVADEDYAELRSQLLTEAAQAREAEQADPEDGLEVRIETAVRAHRRKRRSQTGSATPLGSEVEPVCGHCGAVMEQGDNFCTTCGSEAAPRCSQCGLSADPEDRFCTGCGAHLTERITI